jgi:hypothetical protein
LGAEFVVEAVAVGPGAESGARRAGFVLSLAARVLASRVRLRDLAEEREALVALEVFEGDGQEHRRIALAPAGGLHGSEVLGFESVMGLGRRRAVQARVRAVEGVVAQGPVDLRFEFPRGPAARWAG